MAALVVDASVSLAWALADEISDYADAVLAVVETDGLRVPQIWPYEVANGIALAYIRKRITPADEQFFLDEMARLAIEMDAGEALTTIRDGAAAAGRFGLTAYDAAYVELAAKRGLRLATLDGAMRKAAVAAGVTLFNPAARDCDIKHGHLTLAQQLLETVDDETTSTCRAY
jgi:predicted nucleic acid-binding protein